MSKKPPKKKSLICDAEGCTTPITGKRGCTKCKRCRENERSRINRLTAKENKIKCSAKKQDGTKCTSKVSKECDNKYCEKHIKEWKEEKENKKLGKKNVKRCTSHRTCNPKNPGMKAILPDDYEYAYCENCLRIEAEKKKELRDGKHKKNNDSDSSDSENSSDSEESSNEVVVKKKATKKIIKKKAPKIYDDDEE